MAGFGAAAALEDLELLVEDLAAAVELHAEGLVLLALPAHARQVDQPAFGDQVDGRKLLGDHQGVPEWRDQRRRDQAQAAGDGGHRAEDVKSVRVGVVERVVFVFQPVARILRHAPGRRPRTEGDVLTDHDPVHAGALGHRRQSHQLAKRARSRVQDSLRMSTSKVSPEAS